MEVVRASGSSIVTRDGIELLDFSTGIACLNVGHNHPIVQAAVSDQVERHWHAGFGTYLYESMIDAAEKIVDVAPSCVEQVLFLNSGAEAVEAAVKLAKKSSGRQGVIVFRGGFHGRTMGSVSYTTSKALYRSGYHPILPSVFTTPFPHPFAWGMSQDDADELAIDELERKLKHEILPSEVAALLIEPMQGEGGYYPASTRFLSYLRELADENGLLVIVDEVQTGFGRTGDWFASQVLGLEPDIVVMGKAIASGLPLSAIGARKEVFDRWPPGSHGSTFGGNPIACAAAAATIDVLRDVIPDVPDRSAHAMQRFATIAEDNPSIGDIRGLGLMLGVELVHPDGTPDPEAYAFVGARALEDGLFILPCGPEDNVIRFIPPLNVSQAELDRGIDILEDAIVHLTE